VGIDGPFQAPYTWQKTIGQSQAVFPHLKQRAMEQPGHLVYIVDDRTVIAETLATVLNQAGFRALAFDDPTIALSAASIKQPDALISDVIMPRMSGIDLAIRVRTAYPKCMVLLYSGQIHTADLLAQARNEGYEFEVLAKPVHPSEILARLRNLNRTGGQAGAGRSSSPKNAGQRTAPSDGAGM
jgi:DNA-binding response OmpR family regulator